MDKITSKIDPQTGLMTITKSSDAAQRFFSGADTSAGPKVELTQPYANSVWVMSAISHVTDPIASVPIEFSEDTRGSNQVIDDPELNKFWEKPGMGPCGPLGKTEFITLTATWVQLSGVAFWIMDDTWLMPGAKKSPLIIARPDRMKPIRERGTGDVLGWEYHNGSGGKEVLLPEQVVSIKKPNPYDDVNGLAPWMAAKVAAQSDYAAGIFAKNLMENNGDRGPFVFSDGSPSPEQIEQITRVLREKRIMSRRGDFRPAFIAAPGVKVEDPDVQAVDASFVSQRLENRHEVYIAFKVPPSFADVVASYSVGSASDRFRLVEEACMPLAALIADGVEVVSNRFRKSKRYLYAVFNFDEHSTMQQVRGERFEIAVKGVENGIPWEVMNDYLKLRLPKFAGWDVGRVKFNMVEVKGDKPSSNQPADAGDDESKTPEPLDELRKLFQCQAHGVQHDCKEAADSMPEQDPARVALWEAMVKKRAPWLKRFSSRFKRHLMLARGETLANIEAGYEKHVADLKDGRVTKAGVLDLIFDLGNFIEIFTEGMGVVSRNALETAAEEMWEDELGHDPDDDPLELPSTEVLTMIQARQNHLAGTGTDIWNEVRGAIGDGIEAGDTMDEISDRVRGAFNSIHKERSDRIALTETTAIYEAGRYLTLKEAGITHKEWLISGLGNERDSHRAADGQVVGITEMFKIGQSELLYPGMSGAPASEVINCHCMMIAATKPEEE